MKKCAGSVCLMIMMTTLFCITNAKSDSVSCVATTKNNYCSFFNNRAPKPNPDLKNCTWYREDSCCRQEEIDATFSKVKPLQGASSDCQNYINYLMCYICAPTQNRYYKNERLTVCEDFCNDLYEACKSAILKGSVISSLYSNGADFCKSRRFIVHKEEEGEDSERQCFSKADNVKTNLGTSVTPNPILIICFVLLCYLSPLHSAVAFADTPMKSVNNNTDIPKMKIKQKRGLNVEHNSLSKLHKNDRNFKLDMLQTSCYPLKGIHTRLWLYVTLYLLYISTLAKTMSVSDVKGLAKMLSKDLLKLARDGMKGDAAQELYNNAQYETEFINGTQKVLAVKQKLDKFFSSKIQIATILARNVSNLYDEWKAAGRQPSPSLNSLNSDVYKDADSMSKWVRDSPLQYSRTFKTEILKNCSVVKIPDEAHTGNETLISVVEWSKGLEETFNQNMMYDPDIRWQYFGSVTGVHRTFPGRDWPRNHIGFHANYDPRNRPWYISATSGPKEIVIILDGSSSMINNNRLILAKNVIKNILDTLNKDDHVNIIVSQSTYWDTSGKKISIEPKVLSCQQDRLLLATSSNKRQLLAVLDDVQPKGGSDYNASFKMAYGLLNGPDRSGCQKIIMFLTDAAFRDSDEVRCSAGLSKFNSESKREFIPGNKCRYDWKKLPTYITDIEEEKHVQATTFMFVIDDGEIPEQIKCAQNLGVVKIGHDDDILSRMETYFNFLAQSFGYDKEKVSVTSPYVDSTGLGLVITLSVPVYSQVTKEFLGVVGIDSSLESVESVLLNAAWGSAYGFMIDSQARAIIHPSIKPSAELLDDPVYVDIADLETQGGYQEGFEHVASAMLSKETGDILLRNTYRAVYSHDLIVWQKAAYSHYFYAGIQNSEYSFAFSLAESDEQYRYPLEPAGDIPPTHVNNPDTNQYYTLSSDPSRTSVDPPIVDFSSVTLSPRAFCDPQAYILDPDSLIGSIKAYLSGWEADVCPAGHFRKSVRPDVHITAKLESPWKTRAAHLQQSIARTYIGTESGVTRLYPAVNLQKTYDPTRRPWYIQAIANKGKLSVSSVYLDAAGIGKVVSIFRAIHEGTPTATPSCSSVPLSPGCQCETSSQCSSKYCFKSSCASDVIHGVVAMDMVYADFNERIRNLSRSAGVNCGERYLCPSTYWHVCQTRCYIVDDVGSLVLNSGFLTIPDIYTHLYQQMSLAAVEGYIFGQLVKEGVFSPEKRTDYQGRCATDKTCPLRNSINYDSGEEVGPLTPYLAAYACVKTVISYTSNRSCVLEKGVITGSLDGDPCGSGQYYFTAIPKTNLYLLTINNYNPRKSNFNFNCHISNSIFSTGGFEVHDDPCATPINSTFRRPAAHSTCPILREVRTKGPCSVASRSHFSKWFNIVCSVLFLLPFLTVKWNVFQ